MIAPQETLICAVARLILDPSAPPARHIAVGAASPIPAAACWLVRELGNNVRLSFLHWRRGNPFTEGSRELFDLAGQGRIDLFFLGGGEIDGQANLNLVGNEQARFPGSFGSAFMYSMTPRTILFREEHSRRVFVPRVAFVSAAGLSPAGEFRRGTAQALVTGRCVFSFSQTAGRFRLETLHVGETVQSVQEATGFTFDQPDIVPQTPPPAEHELALLRGPIAAAMSETYPSFCRRVWGTAAE